METTTIQLSNEMKENLRNLGRAGDSFEDIISRMYALTKKHLLMAYLYDESDSISIEEALKKAKAKYGKNKNK